MLQIIRMHQHTKSGYIRFHSSEDIIWRILNISEDVNNPNMMMIMMIHTTYQFDCIIFSGSEDVIKAKVK